MTPATATPTRTIRCFRCAAPRAHHVHAHTTTRRPSRHSCDAEAARYLGWYEPMHDEGAHVAWGLWVEGRP